MDRADFDEWFGQFCAAFPAAADFVGKVNRDATLALWFDVLKKRDLADALAVTIGLFDGALPALPGTERGFPDWSSVPRHVSRLCAEMNKPEPDWRRSVGDPESPWRRDPDKPGIIAGDPLMAVAFDHAIDAMRTGGDYRAAIAAVIPPDKPGHSGCMVCRGAGLAIVWARRSMELAAAGKLIAPVPGKSGGRGLYAESVCCTCRDGKRYAQRSNPLPMFDPKRYCVCDGFTAAHVAELEAFMRAWRPPGYTREFDDFNEMETDG